MRVETRRLRRNGFAEHEFQEVVGTAAVGCGVRARLNGDGGELRRGSSSGRRGTFFGDEVAQAAMVRARRGRDGALAVEFPGGRAGRAENGKQMPGS